MFAEIFAEASAAGATVYSAAFRQLAREQNGVTARNRDSIEAQSRAAAHDAWWTVLLANNFTHCRMFEGHVAYPGFAFCGPCQKHYNHGMIIAARQFVTGK